MRNRKYFFLIAAMSMVLLLSACSDTEEEPVDSSPFVNFQGSQTEESEETAPSPAETTESQELEAPVESGNASGQGDTVVPKDEQDWPILKRNMAKTFHCAIQILQSYR